MNELFFDLIRVALGQQECLSHTPSPEEWKELYRMAKKQSLLGICFAGVQRLQSQHQCPPEEVYDRWMGMSATIQMRNKVVDRQCVELQRRLAEGGYRSCVLKGQGVGKLYQLRTERGELRDLSFLRQSGDIDIWIEGGFEKTLQFAKRYVEKPNVVEHHIDLPIYKDVDVEAHFTPSYLRCPWHNKRLQRWFAEQAPKQFANVDAQGWCVPITDFNLVFLMLHMFRHLTSEGIGLRQVTDYYFVLQSASSFQKQQAYETLCHLGIKRFSGAMMYVLSTVFGMTTTSLLCPPDTKEGEYLLHEIMTGGNFGHFDERLKTEGPDTKWQRYIRQTKRNMHQLTHYPSEALFSPWWRAKIWIWRKWNGWI